MINLSEQIKGFFDWASLAGIGAAFFKIIPDLSAVIGLIWLCLRVWETETVKGWRGKNGNKRLD